MTPTIHTRVLVPDEVVFREIDGETVLLNLDSGIYFGLDEVGTRIWEALQDAGSLVSVCDAVEEEFDVARDEVERDVIDFVGQLLQKGLVQVPAEIPEPPRAWYHAWHGPDGATAVSFGRTAGGYFVRFHDLADVWIGAAGPARYRPTTGLDHTAIESIVVDQVRPLVLNARGGMVLHASAVGIAGKIVAFVGPPGIGKSTLALAMEHVGSPVCADDTVHLDPHGTEVLATGLSSTIRVRDDTARVFDSDWRRDARGKATRAPDGSALRTSAQPPAPLGAVCVIDPLGADLPPSWRSLRGRDAAAALLPHLYRIDPFDRRQLVREIEAVAAIATHVPLGVLGVPRCLDRVDQVARFVRDRFLS